MVVVLDFWFVRGQSIHMYYMDIDDSPYICILWTSITLDTDVFYGHRRQSIRVNYMDIDDSPYICILWTGHQPSAGGLRISAVEFVRAHQKPRTTADIR